VHVLVFINYSHCTFGILTRDPIYMIVNGSDKTVLIGG